MRDSNGPILLKPLPPYAPKVLIIGVQKAGTTTLFDILNNTGVLSGSSEKEIHYFDNDVSYQKGIDWYLDYFKKENGTVSFEASPSYMYYRKVPKRIHDTFGSMKFIVILRDPVQRCYSAWNMYRIFNKSKVIARKIYETSLKYSKEAHREAMCDLLFTNNFPDFSECVKKDIDMYETGSTIEEPSFVRRGCYHEQILRYLEYFSIQDFLFLNQSELTADVGETLMKVQRFMGLEENLIESKNCVPVNSNKGRYEEIDIKQHRDTLLGLYDFYKPHNARLFNLIGREYLWDADWLAV